MRCFPDNKFAYYFFQLADNKLVKEVRKFLFANIKTNQKVYVPNTIFDEILEEDEKYGFKIPMLKEEIDVNKFDKEFYSKLEIDKNDQKNKFQVRILCKLKFDIN